MQGEKKGMEGNNKMEDAVRKSLLTLSNVDQVIFKNRHGAPQTEVS